MVRHAPTASSADAFVSISTRAGGKLTMILLRRYMGLSALLLSVTAICLYLTVRYLVGR